jgi:hypothetical protein
MTNEAKNYIPEDVLDEAQGDPRTAFGLIAMKELLASEQNPRGEKPLELRVNELITIPPVKEVWNRMDDI